MIYEDLFPQLEALVPSVTDELYLYGFQRAGRKFFKDSKVWCVPIEDIEIDVEETSFTLPISRNASVHSLEAVICGGVALEPVGYKRLAEEQQRKGEPKFWYRNGLEVSIAPIPLKKVSVDVVVVQIPSATSDEAAAGRYMDKYADALVYLAASTILSMPQKAWTDRIAARDYLSMYDGELIEAKREALGYLDSRHVTMDYRNASPNRSDY